ncbi:MAG TPA: TonB family protein [Planctomycetota bacterium]|nr:TonB family protein [Planctomycetota bacterium]
MAGNRRVALAGGAWILSIAIHGGLAGVAALVVVGPLASAPRRAPIADASYTVTIRSSSDDATIPDPPRGDPRAFGSAQPEPATFDDTIANIPDLKLSPLPLDAREGPVKTPGDPDRTRPGEGRARLGTVTAARTGGGGARGTGAEAGTGSGSRTGQGAAGTGAVALQNPPPDYPEGARRRNIQGTVAIQFLVLEDGTVSEAKVRESSGNAELDDAALAAVRKWKYRPIGPGGGMACVVRFCFRLE